MFGVVAEQFLLCFSRRADDNIIDMHVRIGQGLQDLFHHELELGVPIANAHGHDLPLVEPFSWNRHGSQQNQVRVRSVGWRCLLPTRKTKHPG